MLITPAWSTCTERTGEGALGGGEVRPVAAREGRSVALMRTYDAVMRTTIDLPDDVHRAAVLVARDRQQTLSRTVADLLRSALTAGPRDIPLETDAETGLPLVRVGRRVTGADVVAAQDDA
jgi:hypothetical protein